MGSEIDTKIHDEISESHSKSKESMLERCVRRHHALDQIIGDKFNGTMTRRKLKGTCLLSKFEPINIKDALDNKSWVEAMSEEIKQIEKKKTWTLVPGPKNKNGNLSRNKARLVCKGYSQEEGIHSREIFSLVLELY